MGIPVKLEAFEGPLDLLLHLIEKNKVSIYDIPIAAITDQYMEYMRQLSGRPLEVMSEFIVMAAELLDIKSRMLLPPEKTEEGEEIDPREELVQRLLEYKMYKYMSFELRDLEENAALVYYKEPTIPDEVKSYRPPADPQQLLQNVTLPGLYRLFCDIMKRQDNRMDPVRSRFGNLKKEEIDTGAAMRSVRSYISGRKHCMFREIMQLQPGRLYKIVSFLTLLELMKEGRVEVTQPDIFADISVDWIGGDAEDETNGEAEFAADYD